MFTLEQATKTQRERRYRCTLSSALAQIGVGGQRYAPAALHSERPFTHFKGGLVGGCDDYVNQIVRVCCNESWVPGL